jgi:hypothetical protein
VEALQDQVVEVVDFSDQVQQGQQHPLKDHQLCTISNNDSSINHHHNSRLDQCLVVVVALEVP